MSVRLEILDGTTPMLEKILLISHQVALESLSVAGSHIRDQARRSLSSKTHGWNQAIVNGKRRIKYKPGSRRLGYRMDHTTGEAANPNSMANFITSYLMEGAFTVVIGARHKKFVPTQRKDGEVEGKLEPVNAVSKASHAILHKLNFGERNEYHKWDGKRASMRRFQNARYVGYNFMDEGFRAAKGDVIDSMTKRYATLMHKAVNRADVKVRKRVSG